MSTLHLPSIPVIAALLTVAALAQKAPSWADLRRVPILIAGGAMAAYQPLFFGGVDRTGVAVGTVIAIGSAPILAGGLTILVDRDHPGARWWWATGTGVVGLALLVFTAGTESSLDFGGAMLCLGAGAAYAVYAVASRRIAPLVPPLRAAAAVFLVAAFLSIPLLVRAELEGLGSPDGIAMAIWLGVAATALAYWLYMNGLRRVTAPSAVTTLRLLATMIASSMAVSDTLPPETVRVEGMLPAEKDCVCSMMLVIVPAIACVSSSALLLVKKRPLPLAAVFESSAFVSPLVVKPIV